MVDSWGGVDTSAPHVSFLLLTHMTACLDSVRLYMCVCVTTPPGTGWPDRVRDA
jgi:hypothetical protein